MSVSVDALRKTALALIIYGYILLLGVLLTVCFYIGAYCGYKSYVKADKGELDKQGITREGLLSR